jgi:hypothetical protein
VDLDGDTPFTAALLPGSHFLSTFYDGAAFTVKADGTIDYDPALEGILTGRGTSALTARGADVRIDASALHGSALRLNYSVDLNGDSPFTAALLPGSHLLSSSYSFVVFIVNVDGTIDYDPALEGALIGRGTHSLVVNGWSIGIDATALGEATLILDVESHDATAALSASLLPGLHSLYTTTYGQLVFTVLADGTIDYEAALGSVFSGRGTRKLTFRAP